MYFHLEERREPDYKTSTRAPLETLLEGPGDHHTAYLWNPNLISFVQELGFQLE